MGFILVLNMEKISDFSSKWNDFKAVFDNDEVLEQIILLVEV